jgi:hypothetical protein
MSENILTFDVSELRALKADNPKAMCFGGAFIDTGSYAELLDIVDIHYSLGMKTSRCPYILKQHCFMIISKDIERICGALGKKVKLKISHLIHNSDLGVVAAKVILKDNFITCNAVPHIVIACKEGLSHSVIRNHIDGEGSVVALREPCCLSGMIGVLFNTDIEESPRVRRPEVTVCVDNCPPPHADQTQDLGKIQEEETYLGCVVVKGARGGKYVIKDGKKRYVPAGTTPTKGSKPSTIVYNLSLLGENNKDSSS